MRWAYEMSSSAYYSIGFNESGRTFLTGLYGSTCTIEELSNSGQEVNDWTFNEICMEMVPEDDRFVVLAEQETGNLEDENYEYNYFVLAFDLNGNELWRFSCDEFGDPLLLEASPPGGYVVASSLELARLSSDGQLLAKHRYDGCGGWEGPPMVINKEGSAVVAGCGDNSTFLQWYDSEGNLMETAEVPRSGEMDGDGEPQLALDAYGNVFVVNRCSDEEGCIAKFDSAGTQLWSQRFFFDKDGSRSCVLVVDADGQPVVAVNNYYYADVIKYDESGNEIWRSRIDNVEGVPNNDVFEMKTDHHGSTYVAAQLCDQEGYDFTCDLDHVHFVTIKFDESGDRDWMVEGEETTSSEEIDEPYSKGSVFSIYRTTYSEIFLSPNLDSSTTDSSEDDDSDSAGCGC